jgi:hypothetical protein
VAAKALSAGGAANRHHDLQQQLSHDKSGIDKNDNQIFSLFKPSYHTGSSEACQIVPSFRQNEIISL